MAPTVFHFGTVRIVKRTRDVTQITVQRSLFPDRDSTCCSEAVVVVLFSM